MNAAQQSKPETAKIVIRAGTDADYPLFSNAFMLHYTGSAFFDNKRCMESGRKVVHQGYCAPSYYGYRIQPDILAIKMRQLYDNPNWKLSIACPVGNSDEIMGALLSHVNKHAVGWITVKPPYQKLGVAKVLLSAAGIQQGEVECAFLLPDVAKWAINLGYMLRFRPYLPDVALIETLQTKVNAGVAI